MATSKDRELILAFTNNQRFVIKVWKEDSKWYSVETSKEYKRFDEKRQALYFANEKITSCIIDCIDDK